MVEAPSIIADALSTKKFKLTLDLADGRVAAVTLNDDQFDDLIEKLTELYLGNGKVRRVTGVKCS